MTSDILMIRLGQLLRQSKLPVPSRLLPFAIKLVKTRHCCLRMSNMRLDLSLDPVVAGIVESGALSQQLQFQKESMKRYPRVASRHKPIKPPVVVGPQLFTSYQRIDFLMSIVLVLGVTF